MKASLVCLAALACSLCACKSAANRSNRASEIPRAKGSYPVRLLITVGGKNGYIDDKGKVAINPQWDQAFAFSEGLAAVCVGTCDANHRFSIAGDKTQTPDFKYGFIDTSGHFVINPKYDFIGNFKEGLGPVCVGENCLAGRLQGEDKWGYVDRSGNEVIPPQFKNANDFSEGLAAVSVGDKWGFIDHQGKFVINPQFDIEMSFDNGIAQVAIHQSQDPNDYAWGYIDRSGKFIWQPSK